jgi:flagellar biosynthesis/type III secretory pathway protein FliH
MNLQNEHTMTVPFDTLAYAKKLEASGIQQKQAEAHAESLAEVLEKSFTPKKDWGQSIIELQQSVNVLRNDMDTRFNVMDNKMDAKFSEVKSEMIKWVIGISFTQAALIISLLKFFH